MFAGKPVLCGLYWLITATLFAFALAMVFTDLVAPIDPAQTMGPVRNFFHTPTEATMGQVQKIFYLHLPVAINTFLACMLSFIASVGYLIQRRQVWDDLAVASVKVAVLLCSIVLLTGMIWGHASWGTWWTWSPRLTFSLMLWLLYVVYLIIRPSIESPQRRALISAVYGLVAFLDVPLVYLSTKIMEDIHPTNVELAPQMQKTLLFWFVPVMLLTAGLIVSRFRLQQFFSAKADAAQQNAMAGQSVQQTSSSKGIV